MGIGDTKNLKLTVVDTAGQEDFQNIRTLSLQGANVVLLCYSVTSMSSLENIKTLWVPEIKEVDQKLSFVMVGNKADMFDSNDIECVSEAAAKKVCRKVRAFASIQCSARECGASRGKKGNVEQVFTTAIKCGLIKKGIVAPDKKCVECNIF